MSLIPLRRNKQEWDHDMNCISYAMGIDDSINELSSQGFEIVPDDEDYKVKFNSVDSDIWESYIREHIKDTYWNEYINLNTMDITFLIKENNEITRVVNHNFEEDDILLQTCNRLCEQDFKTIKDLIYSCSFYKEAIENNPFKLNFDNPNIYMRPATEDDVDNMYDWEMESIDKSLQEDPKVQQLIRDDCYQSIKDTQMIMDQDKTIGMFTACMIDNGEWRYIGEIYLIPEYRGQHIGSTILKNEIANYDRIRLQVAYDNKNALRLYESLGFKIVSSNKKGGLYIMEKDNSSTIQEAVLKAKDRNALDNSDFALVYKDDRSGKTIRKYPIHDEAHVKAAAKMFPRGVPDEYKEKVAKKILRAAHSYDIDTSGWNSVNKAAKNKESHVNEYVSTILEYVSSKQRNREKKFLKERNFVPDKDNPNKGWIDSDFKDKNGKPKRIRFEINPHQGAALHYSTEKPVDFDNATISMSKNELRSKPQNAQQAFKHEEGHLFFFMNYNEWAKKNPIGENESKEDHMKRYMKTGEFKAFFDKVEKAVEDYADKLKGNEHGKKLDEYFADIFGIVNSLDKDLGLNLKSIRTLADSKPSLKDKYKKRLKELEKNAIDLISKEFNEENFYGVHGFNIGPAKDDPRVQEIADLISDIRMDRMMIELCEYDAAQKRKELKLAEEQNVNDSGKKWIESSIRIYEDHAKEKKKKINETKQKIKDLKQDLKTSLSIKYDCKGIEAYKKAYKQKVHEVIQMAEAEVELRFKLAKELSGEMKSKLKQEAAVSGGAYTSKGINWANVQPVTMVYKRFSTKNREQMEPIKRFWEISDKYFPEPSMTSGFGWDWTGWETDFAYGIIINDKKVPPEFMEELKQEFPDIILDENFLIPINYEEVYECSFEEMDATYDKIWSKGFLECEYEQYPALGRMKISVIYKKDADKLNSDISKYIKTVPTVKGYRFTLQDKNVGIYEELKRIMYNETNSPDTWEEFKKSPACSWLPSPPSYGEDNKSYFTKLGYDKFMSDTWPVLTKYINDDTIDCEEVDIPVTQIVYHDDYQFITGSPLEESNTERKNYIMKEQVTKILEAYNSGVLTQEEAVEKIVQEDGVSQKLKDMANNWDENYYQQALKSFDEDQAKLSDEEYRKRKDYINSLRALRPDNLKNDEERKIPRNNAYADRVTQVANKELGIKESAIMNNLRAKQEKIMESYKMGIINGTEGMRLIERVLMEADYITEEEDTAYEGDDNNEPEDITPTDTDDDTSDSSDDSNIESLADYINSLDASERADLLSKINTDVATAGDADSSDDIENNDDTTADDLTPPDGETEEPTADGDTDAEPEVETESAKAIKEPDERLINAYKNVSLDDMEV